MLRFNVFCVIIAIICIIMDELACAVVAGVLLLIYAVCDRWPYCGLFVHKYPPNCIYILNSTYIYAQISRSYTVNLKNN